MAQSFPTIRDVPQVDIPQWQYDVMSQLKEAVEILIGQRRQGVRAVMNTNIDVVQADNVYLKRVTALGSGINITGNLVADLADYRLLVQNVQDLATSMVALQAQVNALINQLEA